MGKIMNYALPSTFQTRCMALEQTVTSNQSSCFTEMDLSVDLLTWTLKQFLLSSSVKRTMLKSPKLWNPQPSKRMCSFPTNLKSPQWFRAVGACTCVQVKVRHALRILEAETDRKREGLGSRSKQISTGNTGSISQSDTESKRKKAGRGIKKERRLIKDWHLQSQRQTYHLL